MGNLQDAQRYKDKKALEDKEKILRAAKKALNQDGSETAEVRRRENALEDSLKQYIHSDNQQFYALAAGLAFEVESHQDFLTAVGYLDRASKAVKQKLELLKNDPKEEKTSSK